MTTADALLESLKPIVQGIAATFGRSCEVVLHDFRRPEKSVVAIAGELTGRHVGGSMSEIGMGLLAKGDQAGNELNYVTTTPGGRQLKSSTMPLRDERGQVFGALCINIDVTALRQVADLLGDLAGVAPETMPATTFTDEFDEVVDAVVRAEELAMAKPVDGLNRQERLRLIAALDRRGVFAVRRAVPRVAARLGISRASAYADLTECRKNEPEEP
ncbi:helix-turn-helix transcriptional regulator [Amycolatopsis nigrescens]|uniref:helix-turn-helix transcriptional regulator n=1 Tax=Amycolatopsis nigrescens TaxID=381445 RepID=UPI00035C9E93|nr:helix-turn-helix transcriptional regulator [Amycolatopsis nigrescens]